MKFINEKVVYCSPPNNRPGRPKDSPDKIPPVVKKAVLLAAEQAGAEYRPDRPFDGLVSYLERIAIQHPVSFLSLLARVLPLRFREDELRKVQINLRNDYD